MNFFQNNEQRNLWIRLNAQRIQYFNQNVNHQVSDLGTIETHNSPMWISNNQLVYDEHNCDVPRFSLEELAVLSQDQLLVLNDKRHRELIRTLFETDEFGMCDDDKYNFENL